MTPDQFIHVLHVAAERNPDLRKELDALAAWVRDTVAERAPGKRLSRSPGGEAASGPGIKVCITRCGAKLLDVDNGAGGCKYLLDACRYEGLIPNDDPGTIEFRFAQRKVKRDEMGTLIQIEIN